MEGNYGRRNSKLEEQSKTERFAPVAALAVVSIHAGHDNAGATVQSVHDRMAKSAKGADV